MTDERTDRHIEVRDGIEVYVYDNGMIQEVKTGHLVKPAPHTLIQPGEDAARMKRLRHEKGMRSKLRGLALGAGVDVDPDAIDEELIDKATDALEVYTAHLGKMFLKTSNIRGMGEVFPKLTDVFHVAEPEQKQSEEGELTTAIKGLINAIQDAVKQQGEVVDGEELRDVNQLTGGHPKP